MKSTTYQGFTLVEAIAVLAIIVIVTGIGTPSLTDALERNRAAAGINWIVRVVNLTRSAAVNHGVTTTLCPTRNRQICGGRWDQEIMVFTDHNEDRKLNGRDRILLVQHYPYQGSRLLWRSFRNRQYLQITPVGFTNHQNGNFTYCPENGELEFARQIVLNLQGRVRQSYDRNNDGIVEDSQGRHLRC